MADQTQPAHAAEERDALRIAERNDEAKASFKTSDFWGMDRPRREHSHSGARMNGDDNGTDEFVARAAWLNVAILGTGYFISRGLAKSGSYEPDADYTWSI